MERILRWEIIGFVFITIVGSLFHSLFDITGKLLPLAIFLPTNESVWEHLKLTFYPGLIFFLIEYKYLKEDMNNFIIAKAVYATISPLTIVGGFYLHKLLTGSSFLLFDILLFIAAVGIGQFISYKIVISGEWAEYWKSIGFIIIISWAVLYALFTFLPPYLPPFYDTSRGLYGIPP